MNAPSTVDGWTRPTRPLTLLAVLRMQVRTPHLVVEHPEYGTLYRAIPERGRLTVGRASWCDIVIGWDESVSRTHAVIERFGPLLTIEPAGVPTNALSVDTFELRGRVPLEDGQRVQLGSTVLHARLPIESVPQSTLRIETPSSARPEQLTRRQRQVVGALALNPEATNRELASLLGLSIETIRTHLKEITRRLRASLPDEPIDRGTLLEQLGRAGLLAEAGPAEPE